MADVPASTQQEVDKTRQAEIPAQYPIDLALRQESMELARLVVGECLAGQQAEGRFVLNYLLNADGDHASFEEISISNRYQFERPEAETCILDQLSPQRIQTNDSGQLPVSYPLMLPL